MTFISIENNKLLNPILLLTFYQLVVDFCRAKMWKAVHHHAIWSKLL